MKQWTITYRGVEIKLEQHKILMYRVSIGGGEFSSKLCWSLKEATDYINTLGTLAN